MAANPSANPGANVLYYTLVLEANDFMATMKTVEGQALTFDQTMATMRGEVSMLMKEFGIDGPTAIRVLQQVGGALDLDAAALERLQNLARQAALQQVAKDMNDANFSGISLESTLRMIEGVIVSMAVFQGIQIISQVFSDAVKNAEDYYRAIQDITAAQSALAQSGISVTNQQLLDIVDQMQQKWYTISEVDMTKAVAQAGLMANEFGLSVPQMTQLVNDAAILHQLDPSKDMAQYVDQLGKALKDGNSLGAVASQLSITTQETLNKAKEMGLVGETFKGTLSDQVAREANLEIIAERLNPLEAKLVEGQQNLAGTSAQVAASWKNWETDMGRLFGPFLAFAERLLLIFTGLNTEQQQFKELTSDIVNIFAHLSAAVAVYVALLKAAYDALHGHLDDLSKLPAIWNAALVAAQKYWQNQLQFGGTNMTNTPAATGGGDVTGASSIDESKLTSILDSLARDYQTYYDDVQKATEEFNNRMQNLQDQYNLSVQKEIQDTNLRMAQEQADFHLKELQQEQDFQLKMQELKNQYLMDLEDGLRKQDAEAVIKTMEKYQNQKTIDQQQEALKQAQDRQNEKLKLEQMKQDEQLRLKQMAEEFKLQQEEAQRAYQQQLKDLQTSLDQKLQEEAVKAQQDLGLNQSSIDAIYKLFTEYYGSDGKFAQTQNSAYTTMIEQSQGFVDQMAAIMQEYAAVLGSLGSFGGSGVPTGGAPAQTRGGGGKKYASGGVALAASATDVTFGEAGPELAMFLPLNAGAGSLQMSGLGGGGGGGFGGRAIIALQLSQDMEARIVSTTLTHAAIQIERVYGSRG